MIAGRHFAHIPHLGVTFTESTMSQHRLSLAQYIEGQSTSVSCLHLDVSFLSTQRKGQKWNEQNQLCLVSTHGWLHWFRTSPTMNGKQSKIVCVLMPTSLIILSWLMISGDDCVYLSLIFYVHHLFSEHNSWCPHLCSKICLSILVQCFLN